MNGIDNVIFSGNLTRAPKSIGQATAGTLAVNYSHKNKQGVWEKDVFFMDFVCPGKSAEWLLELEKGDGMFMNGALQLDKWEGKDGEARSKFFVLIKDWFPLMSGPRKPSADEPVSMQNLDDDPF